jgi:hypothetical protein
MEITKELYELSISSKCWAFTSYGEGWENCSSLRNDTELMELVQQEYSLKPLPTWADEMVQKINYLPFCPHASFPLPYLKILDAIGSETIPTFNYGCYTADSARKERMTDYIFCMDAWCAGADEHQAVSGLLLHGAKHVNWQKVCADLWSILGEHSELKHLLISRILHRERWWVKTLIWDDDPGSVRMRDQYLGEIAVDPIYPGDYGNPGFKDPYMAELKTPEVIAMEERLSEICPDWTAFRVAIHSTWLCGPKAFRFLEKLLWCVGKEKMVISLPSYSLENSEYVPAFLQCADTYPDTEKAKLWLHSFYGAIDTWLNEEEPADEIDVDIHERLNEKNDVKAWLCGLFIKKLRMLNPYGSLAVSG